MRSRRSAPSEARCFSTLAAVGLSTTFDVVLYRTKVGLPEAPRRGTVDRTGTFDKLYKVKELKPHHAAALALVGWYLITPPIHVQHYRGRAHANFRNQAPLAKWNREKSFDSESDCDAYREKLHNTVSKCIKADDSHPKGM